MTLATVFLVGLVIAGYAFLSNRALNNMADAEAQSRRQTGRQLVDRLSAALVNKTALSTREAQQITDDYRTHLEQPRTG